MIWHRYLCNMISFRDVYRVTTAITYSLYINLHEVRPKVMNHGAEGEPVSPGGGHVLHVYTWITVGYPTAPKLQRLRTTSLTHRAYGFLFPLSPLCERLLLTANTSLSLGQLLYGLSIVSTAFQ